MRSTNVSQLSELSEYRNKVDSWESDDEDEDHGIDIPFSWAIVGRCDNQLATTQTQTDPDRNHNHAGN